MNHEPSEDVEKIKLIAYRLWLARRDSGTTGNAEHDYYHAERIFESRRSRKPLMLASFSLWAMSFLLGRAVEENDATSTHALLTANEPPDAYEVVKFASRCRKTLIG